MAGLGLSLVTLLLMLALSGCAIDVAKLAAEMRRPAVTFATPDAWSCNEQRKMPVGASGTIETCSICRNRHGTPQRVTIKNSPLDVPASGAVLLCPTSARVLSEETTPAAQR